MAFDALKPFFVKTSIILIFRILLIVFLQKFADRMYVLYFLYFLKCIFFHQITHICDLLKRKRKLFFVGFLILYPLPANLILHVLYFIN